MAETNQTGVFAATAVYSVMCFLFLVTQGPLEEFCCLATFLDLSLSPLAALPPPPRSPSFQHYTITAPPSLPSRSQHADRGLIFMCQAPPSV